MKDIQQLIKKNNQEGRYNDIFPKTYTDAVVDKGTGKTLADILSGLNMYLLSYVGSKKDTRLQVPKSLRKIGLIITYVDYSSILTTERYKQESIDDTSWGDDNNWEEMFGNNSDSVKSKGGSTLERPISIGIGYNYYDTTLNKPIWWTGSAWVDVTGTNVDT